MSNSLETEAVLRAEQPPTIGTSETTGLGPRKPLPRKLWFGLAIVVIYVAIAVFAPLIAPYDPNHQDLLGRLAQPSSRYLLGTDAVGRDNLSRLLYAARVDLPVAFAAVSIPAVIGALLGAFAAFYGTRSDVVLMRLADVVQAFPIYILVLAVVAALGPGAKSLIIASTAVSWVAYARLTRGEVHRVRSLGYIEAARSAGLPRWRILRRHVAPNVIAQPVVYIMSDLVLVILTLSALSYLGVGIPAPTAEWGRMIAEGQPFIRTDSWLIIAPGLAIAIFGIGLSLVGDALDERLR